MKIKCCPNLASDDEIADFKVGFLGKGFSGFHIRIEHVSPIIQTNRTGTYNPTKHVRIQLRDSTCRLKKRQHGMEPPVECPETNLRKEFLP